ncbi:craniofacial development protein 1 isoform 5 [Mus musculus]|uniref:craniofacial development protein 1 isoform 5 n=1 Tax=Mus musculus TaxID=10090 RepID=UPI00100D9C1D|nr:craniofacial development protein 1 isoform 5 [Mus musculus]
MEEFDSEDFSTSDEDEDYLPSGGEYSEDDVNELVKEDEVDGEEQAEKTKGKRRKAQGIPARVTKEVDAASKEAKSFLKQTEREKPQALVTSPATPLPAGSGIKRASGMSSLLGKIGAKKQKMSTLEKSKLDWESFKEEEGIGEELAIHNRGKEGYIERKAFLDRVDHRQFEIERDLRLSKMKP